jgi:hypothetical protein
VKRFLSYFLTTALVAALGTAGFAATSTPAPSSMMSSKTSTTCPAGETYVKGYTKSDGTKVAGYCRKSTSTAATTCPKGETWVAPYKKSDGTMVNGYCRKSPSSSTK